MRPNFREYEPMAFILEPICIYEMIGSERSSGQSLPIIQFKDFPPSIGGAAKACMPVIAKVPIPFVLVCHKMKRRSGAISHSKWRRRYIYCIITLPGPLANRRYSAGDVTPICMARCLGPEQYMRAASSACKAPEGLRVSRTLRSTSDRWLLDGLRRGRYGGNCWES